MPGLLMSAQPFMLTEEASDAWLSMPACMLAMGDRNLCALRAPCIRHEVKSPASQCTAAPQLPRNHFGNMKEELQCIGLPQRAAVQLCESNYF